MLVSSAKSQFVLETLPLDRACVSKELHGEYLAVAIGDAIHGTAPSVTDGAIGGVRVRGCFKHDLCHSLKSTPPKTALLRNRALGRGHLDLTRPALEHLFSERPGLDGAWARSGCRLRQRQDRPTL